jgi:hypothetical protein
MFWHLENQEVIKKGYSSNEMRFTSKSRNGRSVNVVIGAKSQFDRVIKALDAARVPPVSLPH